MEPTLDLSPRGLDNHGMGTVFEELVRRFNEESIEEAGEHWTPCDAVRLMTWLMCESIPDQIHSGSYPLYYGHGTGGMLNVAKESSATHPGKRIDRDHDPVVEPQGLRVGS